jgi:hypothetical protein
VGAWCAYFYERQIIAYLAEISATCPHKTGFGPKMKGGRLVLPGLELVYLWHGFSVIGQKYHLVERFFLLIEETQEQVGTIEGNGWAPLKRMGGHH